jgi:hypothetical protein
LPSGASAESEASEASVDVGSLVAEPSMVGSFHFSWTSSTHPHTWQKNSLLVLHHPKKKIKIKIKTAKSDTSTPTNKTTDYSSKR